MNSGAFKSSVGRCAFIGKFSVAVVVLCVGLLPRYASAASTTDAQFYQYIHDICLNPLDPKVLNMCVFAFPGGLGGSPITPNASLGVSSASGELLSTKKKRLRELSDDEKKKSEKAASADGGGWGLLVTPQYSKVNRPETDLENGYQADLTGLNVGLDYRFSDSFVFGGTIGRIKDNATFLNNSGSLKTSNNSLTIYGTWLASERLSVDGYLGYNKLNLDSMRNVSFMTIFGTTTGSTTGKQLMGGLSTSYQMDAGRFNVSPFLNLDYIKTNFKGYEETGTTLLESRFSDRRVSSFTSSLGGRVSTSYGYGWGMLTPSASLAAVHEFQNNSQQIYSELVITPGTGLSVKTDAPDRNYLNIGLGVTATLNGGTQLFFDCEKRTQDRLLSSWAVSLGGLFEF